MLIGIGAKLVRFTLDGKYLKMFFVIRSEFQRDHKESHQKAARSVRLIRPVWRALELTLTLRTKLRILSSSEIWSIARDVTKKLQLFEDIAEPIKKATGIAIFDTIESFFKQRKGEDLDKATENIFQ